MSRLADVIGLHRITVAMRTFLQDLRFAFRLLTGSPGFALVAALTLALGIASTATVYTWIDSLLLHPFPATSRSDELAVLEMQDPAAPNGGTSLSWMDYTDFRDHLKLVSGLALQRYAAFSLGDSTDSQLVWGELVSPGYFQTLGVRMALGRPFAETPNANVEGGYPAAVISDRLWRSWFHADARIVGKSIHLNRRLLTVVGVASRDFRGTAPALALDLWVPACMGPELGVMGKKEFSDRGSRNFGTIIARIKPGVSMAQARGEVKTLAANLAQVYPKTNRNVSATLGPPWRAHGGAGELLLSPLRILMAVATLVLLIVCANVGNLLLARSVARHREFGIRIALGASRWRVARQLIAESALLACAAGVLSVVLLSWAMDWLGSLLPNVGLPLATLGLNARILGFVFAACAAAALISGFAPGLVCFNPDLNQVLMEGGRRSSPSAAAERTRSALVIAEVSLAAVALIGAGLFLRSFRNARAIDPGLDCRGVLFGRFFIESTGYSGAQIERFLDRLRQDLKGQAGVEAVSYSDFTPLSTTAGPYADDVRVDGYVPAAGESMSLNEAMVSPGYFASLGIPLLDGRDFTAKDDAKSQAVVIVNQTFAKRYFHGLNPIGRRLHFWKRDFTVIGLARDSKYFTPVERPQPYFYMAFPQVYGGSHEVYLFLKMRGSPAREIPMLRRAVNHVDASASAFHAVPLAEYTQVALFGQNVAATIMSALGLMCLTLAALGIYSVMSYAVSQRTQEIGIRLAMGARRGDVVGMVVRQGMLLAGAGLALGLGAALVVARAVGSMLVGINPADPATLAGAAGFLLIVSAAATSLPALRATRVDPMAALRRE